MEGNRKTITIVGLILVIVGITGFVYPFIYNFFGDESLPAEEPSPAVQVQLPTFEDPFIAPGEDISATPVPTPSSATSTKPTVVQDRLVIAGVNINMPVFLGDTEKTLNKGGWMFPNTSRPELGGNSVIFGHRYMYRPPKSNTFWNLDKVKVGDMMVLTWKGKEYKYKVFETKIVEPTDLSVIKRTPDAQLTVITCTPLFTTKQRLVVIGKLM